MPFDAAWAKISQNFGDDPVEVKAARIRLAEALLSIANGDSRDVDMLKRAALLLAPQVGSGAARWIKDPEPRCSVSAGFY
jgi:hypothetical protein